MGANPHANGGLLLKDLRLPDFCDYAVEVPAPATVDAEDTRVLGGYLRDVLSLNQATRNSAFLALMRPCLTGWVDMFQSPSGNGTHGKSRVTIIWPVMVAWWKFSASINAKAGSKGTC